MFFPFSFLHNTLREKIKLFLVNIGLGDSKYFWVDKSFGESDESHKHSWQKGVHVHKSSHSSSGLHRTREIHQGSTVMEVRTPDLIH